MGVAVTVLVLIIIITTVVAASMFMNGQLQLVSARTPEETVPDQSSELSLRLSSTHKDLKFDCRVKIFWNRQGPSTSSVPDKQIAEGVIRDAAERISAQFYLTSADKLKARLHETFKSANLVPATNLKVWSGTWQVEVDSHDLGIVEKFHERRTDLMLKDMESELIEPRIDYLSKTLDDPRRAALWWFALNEGKPESLNELPDKAKLLRDVDLAMSPWADKNTPLGSRLGFRVGRDLEEFLTTADESGRSAIGVSLSRLYREFGYQELADHAERLIGPADDEPEDDSTTRVRT